MEVKEFIPKTNWLESFENMDDTIVCDYNNFDTISKS